MGDVKLRECNTSASIYARWVQIFIDGAHIGGCNELYALESAGRLDDMLAA